MKPCNGLMAVPITFLDKYNPEQFEIVGLLSGHTPDYDNFYGMPMIDGKAKYARILIRRKQEKNK